MNVTDTNTLDDTEWQAQERGRLAARAGDPHAVTPPPRDSRAAREGGHDSPSAPQTDRDPNATAAHSVALSSDADVDTAADDYRVIAQALRSQPRSRPPADFAAAVAQRVACRDTRVQRLLSRWLVGVVLIATLVVAAVYGASSWQAVQPALGDGASGWMLLAMACVGVSWLGGRLAELVHPGRVASSAR